MDDSNPAFEDCTQCGACCFCSQQDYLPIFEVDRHRLMGTNPQLVQEVAGKTHMHMADGHCSALRVDSSRYFCSIYPHRPDVCRSLVPGSGDCMSHRVAKLHQAKRLFNSLANSSEAAMKRGMKGW